MDYFRFFQGFPVVNPPEALVISFPHFTPRIENPEAFKGFVASNTAATQFSRLLKFPKKTFLVFLTTSSSNFLQYVRPWDSGDGFQGRRTTRTQTQTPALILYPKKWARWTC